MKQVERQGGAGWGSIKQQDRGRKRQGVAAVAKDIAAGSKQ